MAEFTPTFTGDARRRPRPARGPAEAFDCLEGRRTELGESLLPGYTRRLEVPTEWGGFPGKSTYFASFGAIREAKYGKLQILMVVLRLLRLLHY